MTNIEINQGVGDLKAVRSKARIAAHVQRAQMMLVVAGLTAFGIVAVAAAMLMTV